MLPNDSSLLSSCRSISIWSVTKKKPVFTKLKCHGNGLKKKQLPADAETDDRQEMEADIYSQNGYCPWITSLACVPFSDMFASGSSDGFIKLWKISANKKAFSLLANIPMAGFINGLEFFKALSPSSSSSEETLHLAAAVGQEHRLGRWWRLDKKSDNVQNQVKVIQL